MKFAEKLRAARLKMGYTQTQLAEMAHVSLRTIDAAEQYGARGAAQAEEIIAGFSGLCAGGTLSEEDKDAVMKALQDIYWESKARNVQKYTPKKFK